MYTLTFLSAQQLAKDEDTTCTMLESIPWIMYNILFKVAYRDNKRKLLCELVKKWPYSQLKFQMLLQTCSRCCSRTSKKCLECQWTLKYDESSKNKIDAIILGVMSSIRKIIMDGSQQLPRRRLQQLDMTGLVSKSPCWNVKLMRLWATSVSHAQISSCSQQERYDPQNQPRGQVAKGSPFSTSPKENHVDFLVDLQVSSSSEVFLKEALQDKANSPLHLKCRDFYTSCIFIQDSVHFLTLLDPVAIRRVDLSHSKIILMDIKWLMSQITTFQNLQSLKLPSFSADEKHRILNFAIHILAEELSKLKHLKEISIHSLCLSDHVEYLLRGLPYSLESLQLSYCSLTKKDLTYLAQSHHSTHLIKLDLVGNKLTEQLDSFLELLKSASNSLKWLNVTECGIKDSDFYETSSYLYSCTRLSHLGLYGNPLSSRTVFVFLELCQCKLPNMKVISVPVFLDCFRNLPQHGPYSRTLEPLIETGKFFSVLKEMKQTQVTRGDSVIEFTTRPTFDMGDYFDLKG